MTTPAARVADAAHRSILRGGALYLALLLGVHVVLTFGHGGPTLVDALDLVLIGVPAALMTLRERRAMSTGTTLAVVLPLLAAGAIGTLNLPAHGDWSGYRAWHLGAITFVLLGLVLAERYLEAWLVLGCLAVIAVSWASTVGLGPLAGVALVVRHAATLLVGTLLTVALRRSGRRQAQFEAAQRRDRAAEQAAETRRAARRASASSVLAQVEPTLRRLANGEPLDADDRVELLVLEGALRDAIRAPELLRDVLVRNVAAARRRGMDVLLVDEAEAQASQADRTEAAIWLARELGKATGSRFVGRLGVRDGLPRVSATTDVGTHALLLGGSDGESAPPTPSWRDEAHAAQ